MFSLAFPSIFTAGLILLLRVNPSGAQPPGTVSPLAQTCGPTNSTATIVCVNQYGAVMPYHFFRMPSSNGTFEDTYASTQVPNDTSFSLVGKADFLVFDKERGLALLGPNPSNDFMFLVSDAVHEAPVYVPSTNKLYFSHLTGTNSPPGFLPQLVVNLNVDPPELGELISDPPIYAPNGGTLHNGLIYWGVSGGNNSVGGIEERPGIATLDPLTNKTTTLLNNYFGYYFNTIDDLFVDEFGDVWFTDPDYSWFSALTDTAPSLETASYRFTPSTGAVNIVDNTMVQPNGIAISPLIPDSKNPNRTLPRTVYISDSGASQGPILQSLGSLGQAFNTTGKRIVYAFDRTSDGKHIVNRRPIWLSQDWIPDGLKVARNGYVLTGTGHGVDVLDPHGTLLVRIQMNFTVQNFAWAGTDFEDLWVVGESGVARVKWNLKGQVLI